ncbi:Uma2 family endonuclease [Spirosoma gilvum]
MIADLSKSSHRYTVDEYLALEEKSEVRHEFYNGAIYAMTGGTVNYNLLIDNVKDLLKSQVKGNGCRVFTEDTKVDVRAGGHMPYPDVVVTCHPFDLRGNNLVIRQPRLLVEVLSKSTAHRDRGDKWRDYRKMPSLWYYMLVDQYSTTVELFSRIEETADWINTLYEHPDELIVLSRLNAELRVRDIYDGIEIVPEADELTTDE